MFTLNCNGKLVIIDRPFIMGVINATGDSFYDGSRFSGTDDIVEQAKRMIAEGVDIIDIGGQSTRPGSELLSAQQELDRVLAPIQGLHQYFPELIISIDTYYSPVAQQCVAAGASIVNDISAGSMDENMMRVVAALRVPYIIMHMKGTPQTMQKEAVYEDVALEVLDFLVRKTYVCHQHGILDVIVDPGFGFAKTSEHNFELLAKLASLKILQSPILVGLSRKSTIYKTLGISAVEALNGTTVLNTLALENGANILRVHDVKEAKEAAVLFENVAARRAR